MLNQIPRRAGRTNAGNLALTVSAVSLAMLIMTVAGRGVPEAKAAEVSQSGDYTAMTCDGGNEDVLVVLDGRSEQLFVYKVVNQVSVQLFQREDVGRLFADGRGRARGAP